MPRNKSNRSADIDNRIKPALDLLQKNKVIKNDSQVVAVAASWYPPDLEDMSIRIVPTGPLSLQFVPKDPRHGGWFVSTPQEKKNGD
jgi:hypothetical protein